MVVSVGLRKLAGTCRGRAGTHHRDLTDGGGLSLAWPLSRPPEPSLCPTVRGTCGVLSGHRGALGGQQGGKDRKGVPKAPLL